MICVTSHGIYVTKAGLLLVNFGRNQDTRVCSVLSVRSGVFYKQETMSSQKKGSTSQDKKKSAHTLKEKRAIKADKKKEKDQEHG